MAPEGTSRSGHSAREHSRSGRNASPLKSASFGRQAYRKSAPIYSFGTGTAEGREHHQYAGTREATEHQPHLTYSPGPGSYEVTGSLKQGSFSRVRNRWGADMTPRDSYGVPMFSFQGTPGPGTYGGPLKSTLGASLPSASQTNSPRYSWTNCASVEKSKIRYLSQGHERENLGKHSPGPHAVGREVFASMGKQVNSTRSTQPRHAHVTGPRGKLSMSASADSVYFVTKGADKSSFPGPGAYNP